MMDSHIVEFCTALVYLVAAIIPLVRKNNTDS